MNVFSARLAPLRLAPLRLASLCLAAAPLHAAPSLHLPRPAHDFGEKRSGDVVEHAFVLENRGDETLRIHRILTSCGCTAPKARRLEIEPGEKTGLEIKLDLHGRSGPQKQNVTLHTNDPENRTATLSLAGVAVPPIAITPRTLNLGLIQEAQSAQGVVELKSTTGEPFTITEVDTTGDRVDIRIEAAEDGLSAALRVTPKHQTGQGHFTDVLLIKTGEDGKRGERVLVMWQVGKGLAVIPGALKLVVADRNDPTTRYFLVKPPPGESETFKITGVAWPGREVDLSFQNLERLGWRIQVGPFRPEMEMDGETLLVATSSEEHPTVEIPVETIRK